jgi:hypothetical protein
MAGRRNPPPSETVSQFDKTVIPDERCYASRDPESRDTEQFQKLLDPGSRPASRGLAGITNCDTASQGGGGCLDKCQIPRPVGGELQFRDSTQNPEGSLSMFCIS